MRFANRINVKVLQSVVFAFILTLMFSNVLLAGGETIRGKITEISTDYLMIEQHKVLVTNTTLYYDMNYKQAEYDYFKTGMLVEAVVVKDGDNYVAKKIIEVKQNSDVYKMTGVIGAVGDGHILLGGAKILFNADTKFFDINGQLADKTILKTGLSAEIEYRKTNEGMVALSIKLKKGEDSQETTVKGTITEIRKDGISVDKIAYPVGHDTKIYDINGHLIGLADLQTGMYVEVKVKKINGVLFTIQIKVIEKPNNSYLEHRGKIIKILDGKIVVGDKEFNINPDTKVYLTDGTIVNISHLKEGMDVLVYAQIVNNEIIAIKIKIIQSTDDNKYMELKGLIEDLSNIEIKVNGKVFKFGELVKIIRADGGSGNMELLKIKLNVVIKCQFLNNEWVVIQVRIIDLLEGDYFVANGIITHRTNHSIVVAGKEFGLGNDTQVFMEDGTQGTLDDLKEGLCVEVKGKILDGEILALKIVIKKPSTGKDDGSRFEAKGIIKEIIEHTIILGDRKFDFNSQTEILFDNGQKTDASSLKPGVEIEASGIKDQNGNLVALRIVIKTSGNHYVVTIKDYITSITNTTITCHDKTFEINPDTKIYDVNGNIIEISGLKIGDLVYINGVIKDNNLIALYIKLLPVGNDLKYIVVKGKIVEVGDVIFKVGDKVFHLNNDTKIYKSDGSAGSLEDLAMGAMVEVKAIYDSNKNLVALTIKLIRTEGNSGLTFEFKGIVLEVGDDYIVIGDKKVKVDSQTLYFLANGEPGELSSITKGLLVVIKASLISNNELLASKVMIKDDQYDNSLCLKGIIKELGNDYILVNKTRFIVNEKTQYFTDKDVEIKFSDLTLDMGVYVKAVFVNGGYLAVYVKLLEKDGLPGIIERSNLTDVTEEVIYSNNDDYVVNESTKVQDLFGYPFELSYLKPGMVIDVTGNIIDGVRYAEAITIINDMTSVDESNIIFDISVSPNPTAESLNLSLNLAEESYVKIRLFNSNGMSKGIVYEGAAQQGTNYYSYNAGGLNSGMYFMTINVNGNEQLVKVEIIK